MSHCGANYASPTACTRLETFGAAPAARSLSRHRHRALKRYCDSLQPPPLQGDKMAISVREPAPALVYLSSTYSPPLMVNYGLQTFSRPLTPVLTVEVVRLLRRLAGSAA